jgi:DNA-binding GntR family transcriptional regulator
MEPLRMLRSAGGGRHANPGPRPVTKQSIVDLVIDEVRRSILDRSLSPGSTVSIAELSARLNVSHIPVREALRRLEGEGLIELRRGRSAVVAPLTAADLVDILELRTLIEIDLMTRAARLYTDTDVSDIEAGFAALALGPDDTAESLSARHIEFHRLLIRPAATTWSGRVLDLLWQANERYLPVILGESRVEGTMGMRDAHQGLLDAVHERSAAAARRAVRAHLARGIDLAGPALAPGDLRSDRSKPATRTGSAGAARDVGARDVGAAGARAGDSNGSAGDDPDTSTDTDAAVG